MPITRLQNTNLIESGVDAAFRSVMDGARVAVVALDHEGYCIYENASAWSLLGYGGASLAGRHACEIVSADPEWTASQFERLDQCEAWSGWLPLRHRNGETVRLTASCFLRRPAHGEPFYTGLLDQGWLTVDPECVPETSLGEGLGLTPQEFRLLQLLAHGFTEEDAAVLLPCGAETARELTRAVLRKTGASCRAEACGRAIGAGVIC